MNYILLKKGQKLKLHTLNQDEQWFYHAGGSIRITYFFDRLENVIVEIGSDLEKGQQFQTSIPHNSWFEAEVSEGEFCLASCSLAPGFDPRDSVFR